MAKKTRRSAEDTLKAVLQAKALIDGGMGYDAALEKVKVASSVYSQYRKRNFMPSVKKPKGQSGAVDVRSLPPRPKKKGGFRQPKPVDMNDIGSVATRISKIDKKLNDIDAMYLEREKLGKQLLELLRRKRRI